MEMIDTHSHLYAEEFAEDRDLAVRRAQDAGVECILLPNIDEQSISAMGQLCRDYPGYFYPMMGLHPTEVDANYVRVLDMMEGLLADGHPYVAIGEVGLDLYWSRTCEVEQMDAFRRQVEWALRYDLPLMIHSRNAHKELLSVLEPYRHTSLSGVFHCFGGDEEEARELLTYEGFALGIGGVLTYKNAHLAETLRVVPLDRIVLETDSPYLAPVPHRGKRNESAYLPYVLSRLSVIYEKPVGEVEFRTNETVKRIFKRIKDSNFA